MFYVVDTMVLCPGVLFRADVSNPCLLRLCISEDSRLSSSLVIALSFRELLRVRSSPLSPGDSHPVIGWYKMSLTLRRFPITWIMHADSRIKWRYDDSTWGMGQPLLPPTPTLLSPLQGWLLKPSASEKYTGYALL